MTSMPVPKQLMSPASAFCDAAAPAALPVDALPASVLPSCCEPCAAGCRKRCCGATGTV